MEGIISKKRRFIILSILIMTIVASSFAYIKMVRRGFKADQLVGPSVFNWNSLGAGAGGRSPKITIDQSSSNIIYLGTDVAGNFKSIDGGDNWIAINNGLNAYNSGGITVDLINHDILYTTTLTGVYKSIDAGASWSNKGVFPNVDWLKQNSSDGTVSIVQSKSNSAILYARSWSKTNDRASGSDYNYEVYKSINQGETWAKTSIGLPTETKFFSSAIDPNNADIVYLGTEKGIYKTTDGAANWILIANLNDKIHTLLGYDENQLTDTSILKNICVADITNPVQYTGIYEQCLSDYENGSNDHKILGARAISSLTVNQFNSSHIIALSKWGHVYESKDMGASWQEVYHRDNPVLANNAGHLDSSKTYTSFDRDWMSFDSNAYSNHQQTQTNRNTVSFGDIKIDVNPDLSNQSTCANNIGSCDYSIYINIHYGETRGRTMWRIRSSNIEYDGFTQPSTPAGVQSLTDNEKWEVIQSDDENGGNLNSASEEWFGHNWEMRLVGVDTFDLDLQSAYPDRTIYASGMTQAVEKGIASNKYVGPLRMVQGDIPNCSYKYEWDLKWKGIENYVVDDVLYDPLDPRFMYVANMDNGFFQSSDGGNNFNRSVSGIKINSPKWCNDDNSSCFGGHGYALASTVISGVTNIFLSVGKWLYDGGMIFKSTDHGNSWTNASGDPGKENSLPPILPSATNGYGINRIILDPKNSARMIVPYTQFFASQSACFEAFNSCKNQADCSGQYLNIDLNYWQNRTCGTVEQYNNPSLVMGNYRLQQNIILWKNGDAINATSPIWVTEDSGTTWSPVGEANLPLSAWGVPAFNSDTNDLYYGVFDTCKTDNLHCKYGIYKTHINKTNSRLDWTNVNWERLNINIAGFGIQRVTDLAINPFDQQEIYAINDDLSGRIQLIRSKDSGNNWEKVTSFSESYRSSGYDAYGKITFDFYHPGQIGITIGSYAVVGETGLMISVDGGVNWRNQSVNMSNKVTNSVAFHPYNSLKLLVGTAGTGFLSSYNVKSTRPELYLRNFTFKDKINIRGDVSPDISSITVNGTTVPTAGTFVVSDYNLNLGENTISVYTNGNTLDFTNFSIERRKAGDVNADGLVNGTDQAGLNFRWGQTGLINPADFNEDNVIGDFDQAGLNFNWNK